MVDPLMERGLLDPDLVPLVQKLIKQQTSHWSPDMVSDPIQESLLKLIKEKKKALKPKKSAKARPPKPLRSRTWSTSWTR